MTQYTGMAIMAVPILCCKERRMDYKTISHEDVKAIVTKAMNEARPICDCSKNYGRLCLHPEAYKTTGCTNKTDIKVRKG